MKNSYSMLKRQLVIAGIGVSGALACSSAFAAPEAGFPSAADETTVPMVTLLSLDNFTGGFKGWGPMANPYTASGSSESGDALATIDEEREHERHLAEVNSAREIVWVANAPLRAPYQMENIGATKAEAAGGTVRFDSNEQR